MGKLSTSLFNLSDKILNFAQNFEKIPNKNPEIAVLVLYPILYWIFTIFHEPWFDEAQSWQIAKCATYSDILFYLPHFEGHPPFWHLLLSIFAKNNFPYEITIKSIAFVFSYITAFFIVLKAPFFRIIKILLPFTYFLFYHYAIISRPYCMMMLAFCLLAINYEKKSIKYALSLIFLSLCHAYTFVISAFITFVWFIEEIKKKSTKNIFSFVILAVFYILLAITIFPSKEAFAMADGFKNTFFEKILYTFFAIPSDSVITFVNTGKYISPCDLVSGIFCGFIILWFLYFYTKKSNVFLTFIIPYIPFALLSTKYFYLHHSGIALCFIIFIAWVETNKRKNTNTTSKIEKTVNKYFALFIFIVMFSNLYLSLKSCILDVFIEYSTGKKEAAFIKEHHLDNYKIMVEWGTETVVNTNINGISLCLAPYFEKNIFYNFNYKFPKKNYVIHKLVSKKEIEETYKDWRKFGFPDVLVGNVSLEEVFGENIIDNYVVVYSSNYSYIHKGLPMFDNVKNIMVKKELAEKLNLKKVTPDVKNYKADLFRITTWVFCRIFDLEDKIKGEIK